MHRIVLCFGWSCVANSRPRVARMQSGQKTAPARGGPGLLGSWTRMSRSGLQDRGPKARMRTGGEAWIACRREARPAGFDSSLKQPAKATHNHNPYLGRGTARPPAAGSCGSGRGEDRVRQWCWRAPSKLHERSTRGSVRGVAGASQRTLIPLSARRRCSLAARLRRPQHPGLGRQQRLRRAGR